MMSWDEVGQISNMWESCYPECWVAVVVPGILVMSIRSISELSCLALLNQNCIFIVIQISTMWQSCYTDSYAVLVQVKSVFLESYLKQNVITQPDNLAMLDLMWKYYEGQRNFSAAARILAKLAEKQRYRDYLRCIVEIADILSR